MANNQRDIGAFQGNMPPVKMVELSNKGQVFTATHDGEGNPLSAIEKSFISFSWGGKNIEDFSLIVVNDGSRYTGNLYGDFQDLITDYDIVDGQHYWGTTFSVNTKEFQLATDGITEKELQAFRNWFRPGITRELILAEKPNKGIAARISTTPQYSLLPFEQVETLTIGANTREVSSTIWKGTITINFVMDDPFWYSISNIFTANTNTLTPAEMRSIVEEGIPSIEMLKQSCLLANNGYFNGTSYNSNSGINLNSGNKAYLYYCGTGKAFPKISFTLSPQMTQITPGNNIAYITTPRNKYGNSYIDASNGEYNFIKIRNTEHVVTQNFQFTTPGIYAAYNQVVDMLHNHFKENDSILEFMDAVRESIANYYVRTTLIGLCELCLKESVKNTTPHLSICDRAGKFTSTISALAWYLRQMFYQVNFEDATPQTTINDNFPCYQRVSTFLKPDFVFDSVTGQAIMSMPIYVLDPNGEVRWFHNTAAEDRLESIIPYKLAPIPIQENVGDMVRSNFIMLEDRTLPAVDNTIRHDQCLELSTNCNLTNFKIDYKYMYL